MDVLIALFMRVTVYETRMREGMQPVSTFILITLTLNSKDGRACIRNCICIKMNISVFCM